MSIIQTTDSRNKAYSPSDLESTRFYSIPVTASVQLRW